QTFVWNWTWNCDPDAAAPSVPATPAGTTVIVWNWHWSCNGAEPPPITVAGVTVCISCNVNVSVRIASPGDDGDVVQQIVSAAQAAVANIQSTSQHIAAQAMPAAVAVPPVPPPPDVPTVAPVQPDAVGDPVPVVPSVT